jgi:hypothetical protein
MIHAWSREYDPHAPQAFATDDRRIVLRERSRTERTRQAWHQMARPWSMTPAVSRFAFGCARP